MPIDLAGRSYLLSMALLNCFFLCLFATIIAFVGVQGVARILVGLFFLTASFFPMWNAYVFLWALFKNPHTHLSAEPGRLSIGKGRHFYIRDDEVSEYNVLNNKVVMHVKSGSSVGDARPYVTQWGDRVVLNLYLLKDAAKVLQSLRTFDREFESKRRVSAGLIAQIIGSGIS